MVAALKQMVTVQPGGVIEVRSPDLPVGSEAEVIVLLPNGGVSDSTWAGFIGSGRGSFPSARAIDEHIRDIRDWGERDR